MDVFDKWRIGTAATSAEVDRTNSRHSGCFGGLFPGTQVNAGGGEKYSPTRAAGEEWARIYEGDSRHLLRPHLHGERGRGWEGTWSACRTGSNDPSLKIWVPATADLSEDPETRCVDRPPSPFPLSSYVTYLYLGPMPTMRPSSPFLSHY